MFSMKAIQNFLRAETNDYSFIKEYSREDLFNLVLEKFPTYKWKTFEPYQHQLAALLLGIYEQQFMMFLDMGLGKTRISIDLINYYKDVKEEKKTLILVPNILIGNGWAEEFKIHSVKPFSTIEVVGTKEEREYSLSKNKDIYIMTYKALQVLFTQKVKKKKKNKLDPLKSEAIEFANKFDMMIMDETHLAKSGKSLTFDLLRILSDTIPIRYGLTGTPMSSPIDLWSQFYIIDKGETLNSNFFLFRDTFFKVTKNKYWGGMSVDFREELSPILNKKIKHKSIRYTEDEANDIPLAIFNNVFLDMPEDMSYIYHQVKDKLIKVRGDYEQLITNFHKLRMCCGGFVDFKNEESNKKRIVFTSNPKVDSILSLIENMPPDKKVIISYEYDGTGDIICETLKSNKIKHGRLYGGTKDKIKVIDIFKTNPEHKVMVINSRSGSAGLNLQVANYMIIAEQPTSPITYKQLIKRIHRTGQTAKCFIYTLLIKNSVDVRIKEFLDTGRNFFESIIEGKEDI